MLVYLTYNTDNKAATVFNSFIGAVDEFGLPSRVRSDKGGENVDVAWYMLDHPDRGADRGSHITGQSVHIQCIERMWKDLFSGCTPLYYRLLYFMEDCGLLDPSNETHVTAFHYVYKPRINTSLGLFINGHNEGPINTE